MKRINKAVREEQSDKGDVQNDSSRWLIGIGNREVGSIHSDIWRGTASELSENRYVAIYPGTGWWYTRPHLKRYDSKGKYSLVVSISTPDEKIDLYTPIISKISYKVPIKTEIKY